MRTIQQSRQHCLSVNESYFSHAKVALTICRKSLQISVYALLHALVPAWFEQHATRCLQSLNQYLESHRRIAK